MPFDPSDSRTSGSGAFAPQVPVDAELVADVFDVTLVALVELVVAPVAVDDAVVELAPPLDVAPGCTQRFVAASHT